MIQSNIFNITKVKNGQDANEMRIDTGVETIFKFPRDLNDNGGIIYIMSPEVLSIGLSSLHEYNTPEMATSYTPQVLFNGTDLKELLGARVFQNYLTRKQTPQSEQSIYNYYFYVQNFYTNLYDGSLDETLSQSEIELLKSYFETDSSVNFEIQVAYQESILYKFIPLQIGTNLDIATFSIDAVRGILASMQDAGLKFDSTGLSILNGNFSITNSNNEAVLNFDKNTGSLNITGIVNATDGVFHGRIEATDGYFNGSLNAKTGTIGGFDITEHTIQSQDLILGSSYENNESFITVKNINIGSGANIQDYLKIGNLTLINPGSSYCYDSTTVLSLTLPHDQVTTDTTPINNKNYYTKEGDIYTLFDGDSFEQGVTYYEDGIYFNLNTNGEIQGNNWSIKKENGENQVTARFGKIVAEDGEFNGIINARDGRFTGEVVSSIISASTINTVNFVTENTRSMGGSFIFKPTFEILDFEDKGNNTLEFELENAGDYFNFDSFETEDEVELSGESISFNNGSNVKEIKSFELELEPEQNLNGYDAPWPAGGGVNLLPSGGAFDVTVNDIRFVSYGNGTYTINGTATANAVYEFDIQEITLPSNVYLHMFNNASTYNVALVFLDGTTQIIAPTPVPVNAIKDLSTQLGGKTVNKLRLYVANGYTANITISPMLCIDDTVKPFSPYANICPITGFTGVNVWDDPKYCGTVVWNQIVQNGNFASTTGWTAGTIKNGTVTNNILSATATAQNQFVANLFQQSGEPIVGHKMLYTMQVKADSNLVKLFCQGIGTVQPHSGDGEFNTLSRIIEVSTTADKYIGVLDTRSSDWTEFQMKNAMVFDLTQMFGSTIADYIYSLETNNAGAGVAWFRKLFPKDYYAYNAGETTYVSAVNGDPYWKKDISWQTEAGTVYGGTLDIVSGVLTVTWVKYTDFSSGWSRHADGYFQTISINKKPGQRNVISDILKTVNTNQLINTIDAVCGRDTDGRVFIHPPETVTTSADFEDYMSGHYLVYELATPQTYQLTPQEIEFFTGKNNIWVNNGTIQLIYDTRQVIVTLSDIDSSTSLTPLSNVRFGKISSIANINENKVQVKFTNEDYQILNNPNLLDNYQTLTLFGESYNDLIIGINSDNNSAGNILPPRALVMRSFTNSFNEEESGIINYNTRLLLGDLSSLSNYNSSYKYLSGYGLYADNVFLHGSLTTTSNSDNDYAGINTQKEVPFNYTAWGGTVSGQNYNDNKIIFWGGAGGISESAIQQSPFIVTDKGNIFARSGEFKGTVISDSVITQSVIKTPIIYGTDNNPSLRIYDTNSAKAGIGFYKLVGEIDQASNENNDLLTLLISNTGFYHNYDNQISNFISFSESSPNIQFNGTEFIAGTTKFSNQEISDQTGDAKAYIDIIGKVNDVEGKIEMKYSNFGVLISSNSVRNFGGQVVNEGNMQLITGQKDLNYRMNRNGYYCLYVS